MTNNNKEKDHNFENNNDHFFSLRDLLEAFYKRKIVFISVFLITLLTLSLNKYLSPSLYKVGHEIKLKDSHFWLIQDYSASLPGGIEMHSPIRIKPNAVVGKIKELIDNINLNKESIEKIHFDMFDHPHRGDLFIETTNPDEDSNNLLLLIDSIEKQVRSDLKSQEIELIEKIISEANKKNESRRLQLKLEREYSISALEEAFEVASKMDIHNPAMSFFIEDKPPIYALGTKYLSAEISILKNRKNDGLFINNLGRGIAEINSELNYFKALDEEILTASEKHDKERKILSLEREREQYIYHAKEIRLARIAILEEALIMAKALEIIEPQFDDDYLINSQDLFENIKNYNNKIVKPVYSPSQISSVNDALMGTKYLAAKISTLKSRENDDPFDFNILTANLHIHYLEKYLKQLNEMDSKYFNVIKPDKYKEKYKFKKDILWFFITLAIIFGLLSTFISIIIKDDIPRSDN